MKTVALAPPTSRDELKMFLTLTVVAVPVAAGAAIAMVVPAAAHALLLLAGVGVAVALFALVAARPIRAAYAFLALEPFVGGIDRGALTPVMRPSEVLQVFLIAAVAGGAVMRAFRGETLRVQITRLDRTLVTLAVLGSVWPVFWQLARGQQPTASDVFWALVLWRLAALYVLFRWVVRTPEQVRRCFWILMVSAGALALIALAQALGHLQLGGIWKPKFAGDLSGRGGSTLNSPIATGDYLAYSLAVALPMYLRHLGPRRVLGAIITLIVMGSLGTGQFSAWIGLLIVVGVVVSNEGALRRHLVWFPPLIALGAAVAWPVISTRLSGFGSYWGVPPSWLGRIDNLTNFYIPRLSGFHWVLGVRPDPVLPAPETWRESIFLESGVLWFFWVGGIPFFLAFLWFARTALRHTKRVLRERSDDIGLAGLAARASLITLLVLTIIDMHMTMRGGGDLFFVLLGLSANLNVPIRPRQHAPPEVARTEVTRLETSIR
jgi:hypothetical protein